MSIHQKIVRRWANLIGLAIVIAGSLASLQVQIAQAAPTCYPGTVLNRLCYRGYFSNILDTGGSFVLPVISGGQAIPATSVNNADQLYNLLRAAYDSGDSQRVTGAAFIFNTMIVGNAPGIGKGINDAQWLDLRDRLRALDSAGKIDWGGNVSATINSYWQGTDKGFNNDATNNDDAFVEEDKNEAGILIRDFNNNVIYKILRRCANPVGFPQQLPEVLKKYNLTPHVDSVSPNQIEAGSKVSVNSSVDTTGEVNSLPTQWEITQITVNPGKKAPHEDEGATASLEAPCQNNGGAPVGNYFTSGDASCKNVAKGAGVFNLGTPSPNIQPSVGGLDVGDLPVGTRVCFALSVQPRANDDAAWAHAKPICTVVGKKPKVQIWGDDIAVRGKVETSTTVKNVGGATKTFGSWVEYGVFAVGAVNRFASGAGLADQGSNEQKDWSKFTFANKDGAVDAFGNYTTAGGFRPLSGVAAYFAAVQNKQPTGGSVDLTGLTFDTGTPAVVHTAGDLTITTSNIPKGKSVVIIATGTVTIAGNISYADGALANIRDIPQVVIIAQNISIQDGVARVDAWLVANDVINTCSNFAGNLTSGKCGGLLEVNGPVITGRLLLNRTAGSGTDAQSGDPAERFNLRPDAFLWASLQAHGSSKAQTVYSQELPPRF